MGAKLMTVQSFTIDVHRSGAVQYCGSHSCRQVIGGSAIVFIRINKNRPSCTTLARWHALRSFPLGYRQSKIPSIRTNPASRSINPCTERHLLQWIQLHVTLKAVDILDLNFCNGIQKIRPLVCPLSETYKLQISHLIRRLKNRRERWCTRKVKKWRKT